MAEMSPREWQVKGNLAENYERYLVPVIFRPWAADLIERLELGEDERLLDVGCATGTVARAAAARPGRRGLTAGIDLLQGMLDVAEAVTPPDTPIEWRQANASALPFDDGTFDVVVCQQALQFFPDKAGSLREMHRVLAPGGRLLVGVWQELEHIPGYQALVDALGRHVGPTAVSFVQMLGALGSEDELRELIEGAGFRETEIEAVTKEYRAPSVEEFVWQIMQATPLGTNPDVGQADEGTRSVVIEEIGTRLESYTGDDGLAFPTPAHVATARK